MNRILRSQLPPNLKDLAVFDTTTGSSQGRTWGMRMKKMCVALLALGLMLVSTNSFAQSFAVIGGASTTTTTSLGSDPIWGYWGSFRYQVVYTAAELTAAGMVANSTITGLGFSIAADYGGGNLVGYTIKAANVTQANAAAHNAAAATTVKNSFAYNPTVTSLGAFDMITFDASFVWNGTSNILLDICTSGQNAYTSPYGSVRTIAASTTNGSRSVGADGSNLCGSNTTTVNSNKPAIRFAFTPPPPCSGMPNTPVASLTGSNNVCDGVTKTMTASGFTEASSLATQWQVSNTPGGPYTNVSGGTGATTSTYTSAALTAGTYYYVCTSTCTPTSQTATSNEISVTVNALPTVTFTAPNGGAFCGTQEMTASGASTYVWTPAASLSSNTGTSVFFTGTAGATVSVTGTDVNGCVGTSTAQAITFTSPTAITMSSTVPNFCGTGGTATISASSSAPYTYVFDALDGAVLSNATASSVDATVSQTSAIRVTGTDAGTGCSAQAIYSVGLYPLPSATVTTTASGVCPGTPATINSGLSAGNFTVSSIPHVAYVAPATAGVLMNNGVATTPLGGGTMDDGGWAGIPIGFSFNFFGNSFTTLGAGTNGVLMFGTIPGFGDLDGQLGDYTFTGPPYFPNAANAGNVIALLASDMQMANSVNGSIKYWTEGYAPNRRFVIKYNRVHGWSNNPEATVTCVLYETLGMVDIHVTNKTFGNTAIIGLQDQTKTIGAVAPGRAGGAWTVTTPEGWRFSPPANYLTTWSATDANGTTSLTTNVDGSTINVINGFSATVAPALTTTYSISYANATTGCSNSASPAEVVMLVLGNVAPQGVSATSTVTTVCPGGNIPLATSYTGTTDGLTFQWQVSTDGGANWADIAGATAATYTATQTVASSYQVGIASCGGTVSYSAPVAVALTGFVDCYCVVPVVTTYDEEITNVTLGSLNNSSTCATVAPGAGSLASQYSNYTSGAGAPTPLAMIQSASVAGSITVGSCGTFNYTSGAAIFIDYNQNGVFTDAGEMVWNNGTLSNINCIPASIVPVSFTVPGTATPGLTRMRVISAEGTSGSSINPCGTYYYGEIEDYMVQILGPCDPALFTPPLVSADEPDATVCGTQTSQLTAFDFNGVASPIYMWYDAAVGGTLLQNSTSNFYTPAPITATTTWYVATNTGTCITDRFPVTLNWLSPPSISLTNSTPASCGTTSIATDLAATSSNSGYAYTWNATPVVGSGITAGTTGASIAAVSPTVNGEYTYTATAFDSATGCTAVATTTVNFYPGPEAPTGVTGGSTCLNGATLNVSANGAAPTQTLTVELGSNVNLPGAAVGYTLPYGTLSLSGNVSIPAGAIISSANLVVNGLTANGFTWLSDMQVSLSGVSTIANQVFQASNTSPVNGGPYTISASIPTGSGAVTCLFTNTYSGNVTMTSVNLVISYTVPSSAAWFDAATGGNLLGTGSPLNILGTSYLPNASAPFSGNVYAASVSTIGALTCYSPTVAAPVSVGQPLTVAVAASAPFTQTFTLATGYSVAPGATQTLTGTIAIPAGTTVLSTVLQVNGVTSTAGTWGSDVNISMSGASTVADQPVANVNGGLNNAGPYTYTGSNIVAPGGSVSVTFTHNYSFGGSMDFGSIAVLVTYTAPLTGSVCPGTPVTLNATTTGGGANPTYQWNLNGTAIAGATSASYVSTPAAATDAFTVSVTDDCNAVAVTSASYFQPLFTVTAGTITGPPAILVNDFTAPILGAGTWDITGQNTGSTIQWIYGAVSTGPWTTISGATGDSQTLYATGGGGTIYLTATTTTTDGCTIQANVVTVVLGNAIDSLCDAAAITLGNQGGIEWSNAAAGAQPGETYGNGFANPGNTVWFSFVAPASGHVSIETTSSTFWDNYITLFSGSDCTNPGGMTQLGYNDDANFTAQAALMDVTCLIPGTTYYIQMRGYANSIGQAGITLTDLGNTAPVISGISSNIVASAAAGTCAATVTWAAPTTSDDQSCTVTLTSNFNSGDSFPVGVTTVTYTATDAQGLVTTASFTVTVSDTQLPSVTAPAAVTVTAALNSCTASAVLGSVNATDNCGILTSTNNAPATFPIGNTTVTYTVTDVNGNVATATQVVTVEVNPANIWYVDADGDNYGVAGATVTACSQPTGYAANTTDCNDANVNINPGEIEICGNTIDDNCNGTSEEGCLNPGENPSNAISMSTSIWPNCNAVNGTLVNASASGSAQTICLTGEDKWHQFVATSEGVSIVVNSTSADILIELQTAAGVLVAQENAVSGLGGEILNHYGLTAGQVYKIGVRNYNSAIGTGTYSICAKMLKRGGCDYGPGPYTLCQYFKATWAGATGTSYTFTYTGVSGPASGNVYTRTQNSDICVLSSVLPTLPYGSTYNVLITNTYTLNNGAGVAEIISVPGLAPCSMSTATQPATALRVSNQCAAGPRFRGAIVASLPWVCGSTNWRWEFTELDTQGQPVGLPITVNRGAASNYINLGTVLQLQYGKTYSVRTAPILPYTGTDYQWGAPVCMSIVGSAGMIADGSQVANQAVRVETANEVNMSLYPNPTHGTDVNINLSGVESDNVQIRVVDAMGRQVWSNRYSVNGVLNTNITFERPLANGLYFVEAIFNGEVQTQRMMVQK
jgi:hypothetical protein